MDEHEALRQRVRREQQLIERLRLAAFRLDAAQEERTWAIVAAHQQGLPIRRIAAATGLSATRVHQLLAACAVRELHPLPDVTGGSSDGSRVGCQNPRIPEEIGITGLTCCPGIGHRGRRSRSGA